MAKIGILQRATMRLAGGFVVALHEIPPQHLSDLICGLAPARAIPLDELVRRKKAGKSCSGLFAITVDDGVGENIRGLAPLFRARSWPATFYLPTRYLDTGDPMPFQRWRRLKPLLPRRKLRLSCGVVDLSRPGEIERLSAGIERAWYCERPEKYLPVTMELAEIVASETGMAIREFAGPAPILWHEVEQLSREDLLRFESHGISHTALSALSEEEIQFEMRRSQEVISDHTRRPCRHFCYPYGSPPSIGPVAPKVARRLYDSAVTMSLGAVEGADEALLPRIPFYPKNSLLFARMKIVLTCTFWHTPAEKSVGLAAEA